MDHPTIARVLDAGETGSGRLHFVMELVKGIPITRYRNREHLTPLAGKGFAPAHRARGRGRSAPC
jgi:hypothetical protein